MKRPPPVFVEEVRRVGAARLWEQLKRYVDQVVDARVDAEGRKAWVEVGRLRRWLSWIESMAGSAEEASEWSTRALAGDPPPTDDEP